MKFWGYGIVNILISCDGKTFPASLEPGDTLALYAVPEAYSEDGLYLARWAQGELEPVPACDSIAFLLKLCLETAQNGVESLREVYCAEGVTYAEN